MHMGLSDRLSASSEAWRPADAKDYPDHPNPLVGSIVEIEQLEGDYGAYPLIHIIDDDTNEWRWSVFGGVAQKRIAALKPAVGDRIGVKYIGESPSKNFPGKNYRNWKIVVEKAEGGKPAEPDWAALEKAAGEADEEF
jgi:hypothetical protein